MTNSANYPGVLQFIALAILNDATYSRASMAIIVGVVYTATVTIIFVRSRDTSLLEDFLQYIFFKCRDHC